MQTRETQLAAPTGGQTEFVSGVLLVSRTTSPWHLLLLLLFVAAGCRPSTPLSQGNTTTAAAERSLDAETRLREVFRRYQGSSYYEDNGEVILRGPGVTSSNAGANRNELQTESAPLRVRLEPRQLLVDAYTARLRVQTRPISGDPHATNEQEMIAWFEEPESSHFDAQVLRRRWRSSAEQRLRLDHVLNDEVLRSRLSAGLAGPAPQLEWLLADHPMEKLFDSQSQFTWLDPARINNVSLQRIEVISGRERFVFWIQPQTSLIRRVEFPIPELVAASSGSEPNAWSLSLELHDATFEAPQADSPVGFDFETQPDFSPTWVRQFTPLPPPPPSQLLGKRVDLRSLVALSPDRVGWNQRHAILVALPPAQREDVMPWLKVWQHTLAALARDDFQPNHLFVLTRDRDVRDALRSIPASVLTIIEPRRVQELIRQMRLAENAFAVLSKRVGQTPFAEILLTESETNVNTLPNALAVVRDSLGGVDVPERIQRDYESIVREYENRVERSRIFE